MAGCDCIWIAIQIAEEVHRIVQCSQKRGIHATAQRDQRDVDLVRQPQLTVVRIERCRMRQEKSGMGHYLMCLRDDIPHHHRQLVKREACIWVAQELALAGRGLTVSWQAPVGGSPSFKLRNVQVGALQDAPACWPPAIDLEGFAYGNLGGFGATDTDDARYPESPRPDKLLPDPLLG